MAALTKNTSALDQVYNVGLGDETSLNELHEMIQNSFNKTINNKPIYKDFRAGDVRHSRADISKAKNLLGYSPEWNILNGVNKTVEWYLKNANQNIKK